MVRKTSAETEAIRGGWRRQARLAALWTGIAAAAVLVLFVYYRGRQFLASDTRFRLAGPAEISDAVPGVRVEGTMHCSRERVLNVFSPDYGRSVYLIPLEDRRRSLLGVDWVREAAVLRLWPNRLVIRVTERTPVAFAQLPVSRQGGAFEVALIDEDGVILEQPPRAQFKLPVLSGIRREQSREMRRNRVRAALRMISQLGKMADEISEIDVLDPENLRITQPLDGRAVVLILGNQNFLPRFENFLNHYSEIHKRLEHATMFDLRLDDRITAVEEEGAGG